MRPTLTTARLRIGALGLVVGAVALGLLLPSLAGAGTSPPDVDTEFRPVDGDGALPERRPQLRETDAPLSVAERGYAIHLAQQSMPSGARDVLGSDGGEVLVADLPALDDRGSGRRVQVSLYDYATDRLHQVMVDLADDSVVRSRDVGGLQLPPTVAEAAIAMELALAADPAPAFVEEYQRVTGSPLLAAEQLRTVAGVWRDSGSGPAGPTDVCGAHRCLQLLLALPSGQYFGTQDFAVDLSSRTVLPVAAPGRSHDEQGNHDHEH